jgi:predicted nuclease of predicted toxin-antitoxin system
MMRFKIDENLHDAVAALLSGAGHDVHTVYDEGLRGSIDEVIAAHCRLKDRAPVTLDLDFADIRTYPPASHPGMIVLRVANQSRPHILQVMSSIVTLLDSEQLANRLWIVSEAGVRIRQ